MPMSAPQNPPPTRTSGVRTGTATGVGENVLAVRNRVPWGPIIAGVLVAIVTFLLLTILGFALGASVLDPANTAGEIGTWAAIWGAISAILSFFIGGWIAARTNVGSSIGRQPPRRPRPSRRRSSTCR